MYTCTYRFLDFATVDNKHDIIDGNARLGDVGCYDDLSDSLRWSIKHLHTNRETERERVNNISTVAAYVGIVTQLR